MGRRGPTSLRCACFVLTWFLQPAQDSQESSFAATAADWISDFAVRAGSEMAAATAGQEEVEELQRVTRLALLAYEEDLWAVDRQLPAGLAFRAAGRERAVWFMAQNLKTVFLGF